MKLKSFTIFLLAASLFCLSCDKDEPTVFLEYLEIPSISDNQIIQHYAFTLSYNEQHEQADWVAYQLTREEAESSEFERTNDFRVDPEIITESAELADYQYSGYDRGHLAPAGDMKWSLTAMSESFFLSNMSPQVDDFNRGKWKNLEAKVRDWASISEILYIVTGGVLTGDLPTIGDNEVSVPEYYYKVILDFENEKGIGFIMKNELLEQDLEAYAVTIDSVEEITGIDFFHRLPYDQEIQIEKTLNIEDWSF